MSIKEIAFTLFFLVGSTALAGAVIAVPKLRRVYLCLFFIGVFKVIDINFVSREVYRGWVRGFEVGSLDMLLVGLLAAILVDKKIRIRLFMPVLIPFMLYLSIAFISMLNAYVPLYAGFGMLKLIRDFLAFWIVANAVIDEEDLRWLVFTAVFVVGAESLISIKDYFGGVYRARGTFSHSNTLGMYLNMWLPIIFAYLLNVKTRLQFVIFGIFGIGAGCVILTLSRGSWVTMFMAIAIVIPASFLLRLRPKKFAIVGVMFLLSLPPGAIAVQKMIQRVREAPEASGEARHTFNDTAKDIADDRVFGAGINNYSYATDQTIYAEEYNGGLDQGGLCHNVYYLTVGEMGWLGLASFLMMIASMYFVAIKYLMFNLNENLTSVWMLGWFAGLSTVIVQSWLEWALRQTVLSFTFYGLVGIMVAIPKIKTGKQPLRLRAWIRSVPKHAPKLQDQLRGATFEEVSWPKMC